MKNLEIEYIGLEKLKTYANNAKIHTATQIEQIKKSIEEFGFNDPIAVWKDNVIIEGHGRLIAAAELGIDDVPIIRLDDLTDEQRKAYMLVHNKLTMNTGFNFETLEQELNDLSNFNMEAFGFDISFDDAVEEDADELEETEKTEKEKIYRIIINCENEAQFFEYKKMLLDADVIFDEVVK